MLAEGSNSIQNQVKCSPSKGIEDMRDATEI
jgi:hypothetical protein